MKTKQLCFAVLAFAMMPVAAAQAALTVVIDDFTSAGPVFPYVRTTVTPGGTTGFIESGLTGVIGGSRVSSLGLHAADAPGLDSTSLSVVPSFGLLDFSSTTGATGRSVFYYGDFAGFMPAISLAIPNGSISEFKFLSYDLPNGLPLLVNLELANGPVFESKFMSLTTAGASTLTFDLDQFSAAIRANVTGISVRYFAPKAADFRLDSISVTIPEPSAVAVLAPAALAMLRRRRA